MESGGKKGHIAVSETTKNLLMKNEFGKTNYAFDFHDKIYIKSIGDYVKCYLLKLNNNNNNNWVGQRW